MGYGYTYHPTASERRAIEGEGKEKEKKKETQSVERSIVQKFTDEFGYNRESLDGIELEIKLNLNMPSSEEDKAELYRVGEKLTLAHPYARDKILPISRSKHYCYAFIDKSKKTIESAFTEIENSNGTKLKLKQETEIYKKDKIYLIKRKEQHIPCKNKSELTLAIANFIRNKDFPVEFVGQFAKETKECFTFNPVSGRIFVLSSGICQLIKAEHENNFLYQLEVEYYGQINGYQASNDVKDEMFTLASGILKELPTKYHAKPSALTKIGWLATLNEDLKNFKVIEGKEKSWMGKLFC